MEHRKRGRSAAGAGACLKKKRLESPGSGSGSGSGSGFGDEEPVKFMFYEKGGWSDYPADACAVLREAYCAGKEMIRLVLSSCVYLVSFARLLQVDADTGYSRSIAWVDQRGRFRSASVPFEGATKVDKVSTSTSSSPPFAAAAVAALSARKATGPLVGEAGESSAKVDKVDKISTSSASSPPFAASALSAPKATGPGLVGEAGEGDDKVDKVSTSGSCSPLFAAALSAPKATRPDLVGEAGEVVDAGNGLIGGSSSSSVTGLSLGCTVTGLRWLESTDSAYAGVRKLFLDGMGMFSAAAEVTGVYEVSYGGAAGLARKEAFERRGELTERVRGTSNVQHAWYGCSKDELSRIIQHGFGRPTRDSTFGVGVYLTPEKLSRLSCVGADVDENGEQLLLLCRVILGNSERVPAGSVQFHPSSEQFDTGVDNLVDPKKLIVWSTHMNTHILPVYVTSFKLPNEWHEIMEASGLSRELKSPPVSTKRKGFEKAGTGAIPKLFSVLKPELSATDMSVLQSDYVELKNGKLSREEFLKRVRSLAGDQKLRKIQEQVVRSSGMFIQAKLLELSSKRSTMAN